MEIKWGLVPDLAGTQLMRHLAREDVAAIRGFPTVTSFQLFGPIAAHVLARQVAHQLRAGHVGDEAPLDLHHRHARVGRDVAHVGAQRDLEAAAERHAVHRGDHRHRHLAPDPAGILRPVGDAVGALRRGSRRARARSPRRAAFMRREVAHVEPGAEGPALAGQHDGAHALLGLQPLAGLDQALEHGVVERVHLVGADHAHVGDAVLEVDRDAVLHLSSSDFIHSRRRRFTSSGPAAWVARAPVVGFGHISTAIARWMSAKLASSSLSSRARTCSLCSRRRFHLAAICHAPWAMYTAPSARMIRRVH